MAEPSVRAAPPPRPAAGKGGAGTVLLGQVRYANRSFWRQPLAAFFTLVFPLTFLVVLSAMVGNEVIDDATGLRFAQFVTPTFAVFGVCMASYVSLAAAVAYPRDTGVLKRLRGTPLPTWAYICGRIVSAVWVSMIALCLLVGVGVAFYGVQIVWRTLPATILTFIIGIGCFAALGLAVVSLVSSPSAVQAVTNGSLILLAFFSGMFAFGDLPDWVERIGWFFPLRHFAAAVADQFNPYLTGAGVYADHWAVLLAWGSAGAVIAVRFFSWEPRHRRGEHAETPQNSSKAVAGVERGAEPPGGNGVRAISDLAPARHAGPPGAGALIASQTKYSMVQILRDPMSVFFAMVFPVLLLAFFGSVYGREAQWNGLPLPQYVAAAFAVYGVGVMAYVNLAGAVAEQRSRLTLKRLRGTPLPPWAYLAGRVLAAVILGLVTILLVFTVGVLLFDVGLPVGVWLPTAAAFVIGIVCFTSLGLLISSLAGSPQAVVAVALGTLLPLSFISDVFIAGVSFPAALDAVGWFFPLRHMVSAAVSASSGAALDAAWWGHLGVVALWAALAALVAWRLFRWEPRR